MGNRLRELREKNKLTLKEEASELKENNINITPDGLSKYERGEREPKLKTWQKLADFFNVPVAYLQGVDDLELSKSNRVSKLLFDLTKERLKPKNASEEKKIKNIVNNAVLANTISFYSFYDNVINKQAKKGDKYLKDARLLERIFNINQLDSFIDFLDIVISLRNPNKEDLRKFLCDLDYSKNELALTDLVNLLNYLFSLGIDAITTDSKSAEKAYLQVVRVLNNYFYEPDPNDKNYTKEYSYNILKNNLIDTKKAKTKNRDQNDHGKKKNT